MKKYLFIFVLIFINASVHAETFYSGGGYPIPKFSGEENIVQNGATVSSSIGQDITIDTDMSLYNDGTIDGRIDTHNHNITIYNTGSITGGITTENGGSVRQMINSQAEINTINVVGGNHIIQIENFQNIQFADIKDLNATSFSLTNSSVVIDDFALWQTWGQNVNIEGHVNLIINNKDTIVDGDVVHNIVSGWENLIVNVTDLDSMYVVELKQYGSDLTLHLVREQNNDWALNGSDGPLEIIRQNNPNDKMVLALDSARNKADVNNIKNNSYRFNHSILMHPIRVLNDIALFNVLHHEKELGIGLNTFYVTSDTTGDFGGRIYIGNKFDDLYLNMGFSFNSFSYEDNLNDFSGVSYGLDIRAKQNFDKLWLDGTIGINISKFDADYITNDNTIKQDPIGYSEYGKIDIGHDFDILSDLTVSPFAGIVFQQYNITDVSDFDFHVRSGADLKYVSLMDGIKYEYSLTGALSENGDLFSALKIGFWSVIDGVGASFNAGLFKNDIDWHYRFSIDAKFAF